MTAQPVTAALRMDATNPGHTHVSVFVGRNQGARGHAGVIVLRTDEWQELGNYRDGKIVIEFELLPRLDLTP